MKTFTSKLITIVIFCAINAATVFSAINSTLTTQSPPVSSPPGNALAFDGVNDVVSIGNTTNLQLTQGTIEAWIKTPNAGSGWRGIVVKQMAYGLFMADNELVAYEWDGRGNISSGAYLNDNKWHHVAFSFNLGVSNGTCSIYVDGEKKTTTTFKTFNQNVALGIGNGSVTDNIQFFNGAIDEVRVWNTARTEAQIQSTMYNEIAASESGLVAYYKMNQGTASGTNTAITTLTDQTTNALHGTLTNFSKTGTTSNFVESNAMVVPIPAAASDVYDNGFLANWTAPAFGTVTSYKLYVSSDPMFTSILLGYNGVDCGNALSKKVTGLGSGRTYYYRVSADKSGNTGGVYYSPTSVITTTDSRPYGDGVWTGYFFTQSDVGDLYPSFTDAQLKGTFTENENFEKDWAGSGPTINGTTYNDFFHIRYKMSKNYPTGLYNIIIGGDDGVRLSMDGGLTYLLSDWSIHAYKTSVYNGVYLDGKTDFLLDFYEHGGGAHVSFNIQKACTSPHIPKDLTLTNTINATSLSWNANGNDANTVYQWIVYESYYNYVAGGSTTNTTLNLNNLDNTKNYRVAVYTGTNCVTPYVYSEFFTPKVINIISSKTAQTANSIQTAGTINYTGTETITETGFCWNNTTNATINNSKVACGNGTGDFTGAINNLTSNQIYYFRAYATTSTGTAYGNEIAFVPAIQIKTGVVFNAQNSSVSANVYVTKPDGLTLTEQGICWSTSPSPTISDSHSTENALTGIVNGTIYYLRGYAIYNGVVLYGNEQVYNNGGQSYRIKSASGGNDLGVLTQAGTYNGQPYYYDADGIAISYMGDHWVRGLDDSGEIWLEFDASYDSGAPPTTGWGDLVFEALPNPEISYNNITLNELTSNKGCFNSTIIITHNNGNSDSFAGADNEDFVATGKVIIHNLPAGLTATAIRQNALTVNLHITGTVAAHADVNDNMTGAIAVEFQNNAFTTANNVITTGNHKGLNIDFFEPVVITVTGTKTCADFTITADNNVTLENNSSLTINSVTSANQITLNPGAKLNLSNSVTVGNVVLKADDSNSFSAKLSTCMTVNGTVTFQKTMLDTKWYFLSFPCNVNVADITMIGGGTVGVDFYIQTYSGSNRATNGLGANWSHITTGTLEAKKGYAFGLKSGIGNKTLSFVLDKSIAECETAATVPATFYDGNIGNNHKGWNLIGQPYLSKFAGSQVGINYLTTWNGSTYVGQANNLVSNLNPFEAFFVQVAATNAISFSLDGRQTIKSAVAANQQESVQLNFTNTSGNDFSTLIFDNELSTEYEIGHDLEKWISTDAPKPQLYSILNGIKFAYNALPLNNAVNLPLGYYSKTGGSSTISASNISVSGLSKLWLTDTQTGKTTDLLSTDYRFDASAGTNNSRFTITLQRISTIEEAIITPGKPSAYVKNNQIYIQNVPLNATIRLYDITGKIIANKYCTSNMYQIPLSKAGMFVVQIGVNSKIWNLKIVNN